MLPSSAARPPAWLLTALLAVICLLWVPVALLMKPSLDDARAATLMDRERMTADFAAALLTWAGDVQLQAMASDAVEPPRNVAAGTTEPMKLQERLLATSPDEARVRELRRVIETRAEVAAARDLVVQLRMAGETRRADAEYARQLRPAAMRLTVDAEQLTLQSRAATDALAHRIDEDSKVATRTMQLIFALGLVALTLAALAHLKVTTPVSRSAAGSSHGGPGGGVARPAEMAQALLRRARRDDAFAGQAEPLRAGEPVESKTPA